MSDDFNPFRAVVEIMGALFGIAGAFLLAMPANKADRLRRLRMSSGLTVLSGISQLWLTIVAPAILPEVQRRRTRRSEMPHSLAASSTVIILYSP